MKLKIALYCILGAVTSFFVYFPITDTDIWWHLASAREIIARKAWLYADPFSFTLDKPEWIDLHWLFQLAAYAVYKAGGNFGLVFAKCIIAALTGVILCMVFPKRLYAVVSVAIFSLLIFEARYLVLERPTMVTIAGMAIFIFCLERYSSSRRMVWLWPLIGLQIIWTNSQGLFIIGPAIAGAYWIGDCAQKALHLAAQKHSRKIITQWREIIDIPCAVFLLALIASCLINPYGWNGLAFPLKLFGRIAPVQSNIYAYNISENLPLLRLFHSDPRMAYAVCLTALAGILSFIVAGKQMKVRHAVVFAAFLFLACIAQRNILLFFIVCVPVIGHNISIDKARALFLALPAGLHQTSAIAIITAFFMLFAHDCALQTLSIIRYPKHSAISPFRVPVAAIDYLKKNPVPGHMFNSIRFGGYCIWELYPCAQVFVDGRMIIRSPAFFAEYLAMLDSPQLFDNAAQRFDITHVLLPTAIFYLYMDLVKYLYGSPGWKLVFADGASVLFVRSDMHDGPGLDLTQNSDREKVVREIERQWKNDRYIRAEAISYFNRMLDYLSLRSGGKQL